MVGEDEAEILKSLVKQGAFEAAKKYVEFLEAKSYKAPLAPKETPPREDISTITAAG